MSASEYLTRQTSPLAPLEIVVEHLGIQSPKVPTPVREGNKSICANLSQRGCPSLNGPTSVEEGIQAFRAPKCRHRSKRAASPFVPTSVGEDVQASTGQPRSKKATKHSEPRGANFGRRGQQVHSCRPRAERMPKPLRADLGQRRLPSIQSPKVPTLVGEGRKSIRADLGRRGCLSLQGPTSVREGFQAFRAPKCRLR